MGCGSKTMGTLGGFACGCLRISGWDDEKGDPRSHFMLLAVVYPEGKSRRNWVLMTTTLKPSLAMLANIRLVTTCACRGKVRPPHKRQVPISLHDSIVPKSLSSLWLAFVQIRRRTKIVLRRPSFRPKSRLV